MDRRALRPRPTGLVIVAIVLLLILGTAGPATASAGQQAPVGDELELVDLIAGGAGPGSPPGTIRLQAQLSYRLQSVPRAFLLLLMFENDAENSSQQTSEPIPITVGTGQLTLDLDYQPGPDVRSLSLLGAIFTEDDRLLTFVSTTPFSLAPWPGRAAFEEAMAARLAGNNAEAVEHLTKAIELSPETGNYYYWRADTSIRLGQYDAAIADYTRALERMPRDRASRVGRGVAFLWTQRWQPALDDLTAVISSSPKPDRWTAWAHRARGIAYSRLDQPAAAIADYEAYLALAPNAPDRAEVEGWIAALR
jgi:tetratricopeptide (TPR) repeat protein